MVSCFPDEFKSIIFAKNPNELFERCGEKEHPMKSNSLDDQRANFGCTPIMKSMRRTLGKSYIRCSSGPPGLSWVTVDAPIKLFLCK